MIKDQLRDQLLKQIRDKLKVFDKGSFTDARIIISEVQNHSNLEKAVS